jgi:hypothetical protein
MKIRTVEAELFHADGWTGGQTDMAKLMVALRQYATWNKAENIRGLLLVSIRMFDFRKQLNE